MKKSLALLLTLCLLLSLLPAGAFAAEEQQTVASSGVYINPLYYDELTGVDIPFAYNSDGDETVSIGSYTSVAAAGAAARQAVVDRKTSFSLNLILPASTTVTSDVLDEWFEQMYAIIRGHTGAPYEGDYIRCNFNKMSYDAGGTGDGTNWTLTYTFTASYKTNASQEAYVRQRVSEILSELGVANMDNEYDKIYAIYSWITSHVTYDHANLNVAGYDLKYTAYAALANGTCVCQGYAGLFYCMALSAGLSARCVTSDGHMWNAVTIDGVYYHLDATWDAGVEPSDYDWFLKSYATIIDESNDQNKAHVLDDEGTSIVSTLNMTNADYAASIPLANGVCGKNLVWKLTREGTLRITGTGAMYDYTEAEPAPWYSYRSQITGLSLGSDITAIGTYAFADTKLTNFAFDGTAAQWEKVSVDIGNDPLTTLLACEGAHHYTGSYADGFCKNCKLRVDLSNMTVLYLPDDLTELQAQALAGTGARVVVVPENCLTLGSDVLAGCANLQYLFLPAALEDELSSDGWSENVRIVYYEADAA